MTDSHSIETLSTLLLSPKKSGLYFSKAEIISFGMHLGINVPLRDRALMLEDMFRLLKQEELGRFFENLLLYIDTKIAFYDSLAVPFSASSDITQAISQKLKSTREKIVELHEEILALS